MTNKLKWLINFNLLNINWLKWNDVEFKEFVKGLKNSKKLYKYVF